MRTFRLVFAVVLFLALAGCGPSEDTIMPDVIGKRLDVAKSDIEQAGFKNDVEIVGGGVLGILAESNWLVCEQLPATGEVVTGAPRLMVDRSCNEDGPEPSATPSDESNPEPSATASDESSEPNPEPVEPSKEPEANDSVKAGPVTNAEVVDAFRAFFDERAASGVVFAKAITDVSFSDRVVRVTFDPAAAGIDQDLFDQVNPFENLAVFAGTPISFDDDLGIRLRPAIDAIETVRADGIALGSRTTADIIELNGLGD